MKIYITMMQGLSAVNDESVNYSKAHALLSALKERGHKLIYIADDEFNNYEYVGVYKALRSCDFLLAFTDSYTCSSTWRCSEITYAMCGMGAFEKVDHQIPVFIYRGVDAHCTPFIRGILKQPGVYALPDDADVAANMITNFGELVTSDPEFYTVKKR